MTRRFTETEKWDDPWFWRLTDKTKILFSFLCDKVDQGGFFKWDSGLVAMKTRLKESVVIKSLQELLDAKDVDDKLKVFMRGGYIYLHSHVKVQDPNGLSVTNTAHMGVLKRLLAKLELFPECAVYLPGNIPKMKKNVNTLLKSKNTQSRESALKNLLSMIDKADESCRPLTDDSPPLVQGLQTLIFDDGTPPMIQASLKVLQSVDDYPYDLDKDRKLLIGIMRDYPGKDILAEIKKKAVWWIDNPLTKRSNPRLQITNWFETSTEFVRQKVERKKIAAKEQRDIVKKRLKNISRGIEEQKRKDKKQDDEVVRMEKWFDEHTQEKDIREVAKLMECETGEAIYFMNLRRKQKKLKKLKGEVNPMGGIA